MAVCVCAECVCVCPRIVPHLRQGWLYIKLFVASLCFFAASSPLGSPDSASIMRRGMDKKQLIEDPTVLQLAAKYNKSPAQVCCGPHV